MKASGSFVFLGLDLTINTNPATELHAHPIPSAGLSKIVYDMVLYLTFWKIRPPEERGGTAIRNVWR